MNTDDKDPLAPYIKDTRSPLARLIGDAPVPHRVFNFAGAGGRFGEACAWAVRALSAETKERAMADAFAWLSTKGGWESSALQSEQGEAVLELECKVQALAHALVVPEQPTQRIGSADELRKLLEPDEISALFEEYIDFHDERSPFRKLRTWEEVEPLAIAVGKGFALPTALNSCDTGTLRFIVLSLASRYVMLTMQPSSATSSPSETST